MSERVALTSPVEVAPPPGFRACALHDPFEAYLGPLFEAADGSKRYAFYVDERHLAEDGRCHEGMLMTFADAFLGSAAHHGSGGKTCVTLSMQASYLGLPKLGDLVEVVPELDHRTRAILFVSGSFFVGDQPVMRATSLWKVLGAN